jgi:hypothetical protein
MTESPESVLKEMFDDMGLNVDADGVYLLLVYVPVTFSASGALCGSMNGT